MTPLWHDGPLATLAWDGEATVVWSVAAPDDRGVRHALARALIGRLAGVSDDRVRLVRSAAGAAIVEVPVGWHVGLSSRGGRCLIGAARRPVAVDCEIVDAQPPLWDMLTPAEADALRALPAAIRSREWLRRWTIKEAHAKLVGEPRRIAPEAIETIVTDDIRATASFEGLSQCRTRTNDGAIETVAQWKEPR